MKVARVVLEARTASFRMPHFLVGVQPTHPVPPPSTIEGLVSAALGRHLRPGDAEFAYHITSRASFDDLEDQHQLKIAPRTAITVQPVRRSVLFDLRLVLYLRAAGGCTDRFRAAFRSPVWGIALGRSQDLATVVAADQIELERRRAAYFEHTLLPFSMRPRLGRGLTTLLASHVGPAPERVPTFQRYIVLQETIFAGEVGASWPRSRRLLGGEPGETFWADPGAPRRDDAPLGLVFQPLGPVPESGPEPPRESGSP